MKTQTIRLPVELIERIRGVARGEGRFMREIVRRAVEVYLGFSAAERATFDYTAALKRLRATEEAEEAGT